MGYLTEHYLVARRADRQPVTQEQYEAILKELKAHDLIGYALDSGYLTDKEAEFYSCDMVKWYDHDQDMLAISKVFPDMVFMLHGNGEDSEDLWQAYYKNSRMEHCQAQIVFPKPETICWD